MNEVLVLSRQDVPEDSQWLGLQPCPVIVYGDQQGTTNADVVVQDQAAAETLAERVRRFPQASLTLVQVLRSTDILPAELALDMESLAYATLQSGGEFSRWLATQTPSEWPPQAGDPILLSRDEGRIEAVLNRPDSRNSITVEMRDALVEVLQLLDADSSIEQLSFYANGACFSVGGELREFGQAPDPATAHWVRTVHSPARLLAKLGSRISCHVHGACIGSGLELPAFAAKVIAHRKTFFQLPELELGLIPGAGGTVSISRRIGRQRTAWLVLSGRRINSETALDWGLIDEIEQ